MLGGNDGWNDHRGGGTGWTGNDYGGGHGISSGWNTGTRNAGNRVAGVHDNEWDCSGRRGKKRHSGIERELEHAAGAECGRESGGCVLHRRISVERWNNEDGVLAGGYGVSGEPGDGEGNAWVRNGVAAGVIAVRKFGAGDESERQQRGALEWNGDDRRGKDIFNCTKHASAGEYGRRGE